MVGVDGAEKVEPWRPDTWYVIRDDHPHLDVLVRGQNAQATNKAVKFALSEPEADELRWCRWDFAADLAHNRRLGEICLALKVPKGCVLRCYVIPAALLTYRDVVVMTEDIEAELGFRAAWDVLADRPDRSWSSPVAGSFSGAFSMLSDSVDEELHAALLIRRQPFVELGPLSMCSVPLVENALVSHWATRRSGQLYEAAITVTTALDAVTRLHQRGGPDGRQKRLVGEATQLTLIVDRLTDQRRLVSRLISDAELGTSIQTTPLIQRDHRLRLLLRAFAPPASEAFSEIAAARSCYPPVFLNRLWELWGAVWLARTLRSFGFQGSGTTEALGTGIQCSWRLERDGTTIELDFEPEPVSVDYGRMPAAHQRDVPALEWAARHQELDDRRPFLALEEHSSPDYLIRITTPTERLLVVGDACLATAAFHGNVIEGVMRHAKPNTVEQYRRTIGWVIDGSVVRCHLLGGFVLFPPPASNWTTFETLPGAADCMLLCPSPGGDKNAGQRLQLLLHTVASE